MQILRQVSPSAKPSPAVVVLCAEEELRDVITYWFAALPIDTVAPSDGYEANRILRTATPTLLVTDRTLPPWPGLDTFRQLRAANPRLRIAYVDDGGRDSAILARVTGADLVLTRPLKRQQVVAALGARELTP